MPIPKKGLLRKLKGSMHASRGVCDLWEPPRQQIESIDECIVAYAQRELWDSGAVRGSIHNFLANLLRTCWGPGKYHVSNTGPYLESDLKEDKAARAPKQGVRLGFSLQDKMTLKSNYRPYTFF